MDVSVSRRRRRRRRRRGKGASSAVKPLLLSDSSYTLNIFENGYEVEIIISNYKIIVDLGEINIGELKEFYESLSKPNNSSSDWTICRDMYMLSYFIREGAFVKFFIDHVSSGCGSISDREIYSCCEINFPLNDSTKQLFGDLIYIYEHWV